MQFEKLQRRRQGKCRCPNCFDLVQDKVINRSLYALIAFLVFLLIAYNLALLTAQESTQVSEIKLGVPVPYNTQFQTKFSTQRTPTIFLRNKYGEPVSDTDGGLIVTTVLSPIADSRPQCNTLRLFQLLYTLEYIRFGEICRPILRNIRASSDDEGIVTFPDFFIERGPEGTYNVAYVSGDALSEIEHTSVSSKAHTLNVNTAPPLFIKIGEVISPQPEVTIIDDNGLPIQGKQVVAFSWVDSHFNPNEYDDILLVGDKLSLFEGEVSEPSDANGVARFTNLKVVGSTTAFVHIFFSVDGKVVEPWLYQPLKPPAPGLPIPPQGRWPLLMGSDVVRVQIVTAPPQNVTEGEIWPVQPKIRVVDAAGNGVADQVVIAITYGGISGLPPLGYRNLLGNIPNKKLYYPVEGEYADFIFYLNSVQQAFTPVKTDANGQIQFTSLAYNTAGFASKDIGPQSIFFLCNGVWSNVTSQNVESRVDNITLTKPLPSSLTISQSSEYDAIVRLRVVDATGRGVSGKEIWDLGIKVESPDSDSDLVVKARNDIDQASVSDQEGFMAIPIKILIAKKDRVNATFNIHVDNQVLKTDVITFYGNLQYVPESCAHIEVIIPPPEIVKNEMGFPLQYRAVKQDGSPIEGIKATAGVYFKTEYPNKIKPSVINSVDPAAAKATSTADGSLIFTNFKFLQQPSGTVFFRAVGQNSDGTECNSDFSFLLVQNLVEYLELVSPTNEMLSQFDKTVPFETDQPTTLRMKDSNNVPLQGATVTIEIEIAHMPVNLFSEYVQTQDSSTFITLNNSTYTTDANGEIQFSWKLKQGNVGMWTIIFKVDGKYTVPFCFKSEWDSGAKVNIVRQPTSGGIMAVGNYLDSNGGVTIEVKDSSNSPVQNIMVSTSVIPVDANGDKEVSGIRTEGIIDLYTTTLQDIEVYAQYDALSVIANSFITFTGEKNGRTDANGQVTLDKLTLVDLSSKEPSCFKFLFYIGTYQGKNYTLSAPSDKVCFQNNMSIELRNTPSSKISPNHPMAVAPTIRFQKVNSSDSDRAGLFIFVGIVSEVNSVLLSNRFFGSQSYFQNNVCAFYNKTNIVGGCSDIAVINDGKYGNYIAETSFTNLKYTLSDNVEIKARFSTPFQGEVQYVQTQNIQVVLQAEVLELVEQPPKEIELYELFQVKVKATLSNGAPLAFVGVNANITASKAVSSFSNSMFNFAANLQTGINNMNQLSAENNIRLNPVSGTGLTNNQGIATLTLQITSGIPGNYSIVASSGTKAQSAPSSVFNFTNTIERVDVVMQLEQSHEISYNDDAEEYELTLDPQPIVSVTNAQGEQLTTMARDFTVFVISESDLNAAQQKIETQSDNSSPGISSILQNIVPPSTGLSQALSTVTSAWTILTRGAAEIGALSSNTLTTTAQFSEPSVNGDGNYVFSDLTIKVKTAQKYKLVFMVNGMETQPSESVEIIDIDTQSNTEAFYIMMIILIGLIIAFLLYSAITSNAYTYSKTVNLIYIIISLACCVVLLIFILVIDFSLILSIFLIITILLICGSLIYNLVMLFSPRCRKYIFYVEWEKVSREYTYQKLFNRPSNKWIAEKGQPGQYEDVAPEYHPLNPAQYDEQQKEFKGFGEVQFKKQSFMRRMVELFVPFQISANRLNVGDCFFYPQRFFIAFLIAFFGFIFIAVNLFQIIVSFRSSVQSLKHNSVETIFNFVRVGVKKVYLWVKIDPDDSNLEVFVTTSNIVEVFLDYLALAFYVAAIIGTVIATLMLAVSMLTLFYDFKKRVLQARQGFWPYPRSRFSLINSTSYVGSLISSFILGYAVIAVLLTLFFIPLCHPVTWLLLWVFKWTILVILAPSILNALLKVIAGKICVAKAHVRYRRCFSILELFLLYTAIPAGIITGLVRFIIMLVVGILTLSKVDTPIAPMWVLNRVMWIDFPNGAYNGLILEHHTHRNPLVTTAMYSFLSNLVYTAQSKEIVEQKPDFQTLQSRRVAHRFQLLLLLMKNPSLIKHRKHNLPKKKEELEESYASRRSTITDNFKNIEMQNMNL